MSAKYIVAIDAGTTSIRVLMYDKQMKVVRKAQQEFTQHYPKLGWVEHDADQIWKVTRRLLNQVLKGREKQVAAIGITNQRETAVVWDAKTSKPIHRAIVWQDRRTADVCASLKKRGHEKMIQGKTGLVLDPYFSGTKVAWMLDHVRGARKKAKAGKLRFGTIDSWLIWNLAGGEVHATDFTNASRTMLYNIKTKKWDPQLLKLLKVPASLLPKVKNSSDDYGTYKGIPIAGVAGDQQAALFGQAGVHKGEAKNTYGTGLFLLMNIGKKFVRSKNDLLTTLTPDANGKPVYALEGAAFMGGAIMQWLRDELGILKDAKNAGKIAASVPDTHGVVIVPAFVGLGAPYWKPDARGIITGLTRGTNRKHIIRAAEEAIAYQVMDLVEAMEKDSGVKLKELFVDGGAARDNFLMQFQADMLRKTVVRPKDLETTVRGAAMLAGLHVGFWKETVVLEGDSIDKSFRARLSAHTANTLKKRWVSAVHLVVEAE